MFIIMIRAKSIRTALYWVPRIVQNNIHKHISSYTVLIQLTVVII